MQGRRTSVCQEKLEGKQLQARKEQITFRRPLEPEAFVSSLCGLHPFRGVEQDDPLAVCPRLFETGSDQCCAYAAPLRMSRDRQHPNAGGVFIIELGERVAGIIDVGDASQQVTRLDCHEHLCETGAIAHIPELVRIVTHVKRSTVSRRRLRVRLDRQLAGAFDLVRFDGPDQHGVSRPLIDDCYDCSRLHGLPGLDLDLSDRAVDVSEN